MRLRGRIMTLMIHFQVAGIGTPTRQTDGKAVGGWPLLRLKKSDVEQKRVICRESFNGWR